MVKLNQIYTKTGDDGTTGLVGGKRCVKYDALVEAYGSVDEANSVVGIARLYVDPACEEMLKQIQNDLFDLGADLATLVDPTDDLALSKGLRIIESQVLRLEQEIDSMNAKLSPLQSFILPGGSKASSYLHLARSTVRRAERKALKAGVDYKLNPLAIHYLNRLSDHLFVMARLVNDHGKHDILWVPGANR